MPFAASTWSRSTAPSTPTSRTSGASSSRIHGIRGTCSRCTAWATNSPTDATTLWPIVQTAVVAAERAVGRGAVKDTTGARPAGRFFRRAALVALAVLALSVSGAIALAWIAAAMLGVVARPGQGAAAIALAGGNRRRRSRGGRPARHHAARRDADRRCDGGGGPRGPPATIRARVGAWDRRRSARWHAHSIR